MLINEITDTFILVWSHNVARITVLLIIFLSLLFSIFFSIFASLIIVTSYLVGCVLSFCLVKYKLEVGFCLQRLADLYYGHRALKRTINKSCDICDDQHCNRHKNIYIKEPWKDIYIYQELNLAVENFYNKILETFIESWYKNFTDDESFTNELRMSFRYVTSMIVKRYNRVDLGKLVSNKLVPCALKHIHDCLQIESRTRDPTKMNCVAIEHLGNNLHVAVTNRRNELTYLRHLTNCLLPHLLPRTQLRCKNFHLFIKEIIAGWVFLPMMDAIADPNVVNLLVNLATQRTGKAAKMHARRPSKVQFLCNFTNHNVRKAALGHELTKILKSPELLYAFMQFLKEEGPVNVLQFCLDVEEFNKKLLTPELSKRDLENLHSDAMLLYNTYLSSNSADSIRCPRDISSAIENLLHSGWQNVSKLRTSAPLYKAYDYAFGVLENEWLPVFNHSDEFYKQACGPKITANYQKSASTRNKKHADLNSHGTVSKISSGFSRMKNVLRTQPIDGAVYQTETPSYEPEHSLFIEQNTHRDLSVWRVSISHAEQSPIPKPTCTFFINIKRIDVCSENERCWTVQRQDQDFHTLKIKLVEFHGENEISDSPLPSRRLTAPLEIRKQKYEEFLQKLLQKPTLRGSDLLYTFLTTKQNFTVFADTSMPIVSDLGNIYHSVAYKLRKEKGQHLDSFLNTFLASTETGKSRPSKFESPDVGEEADSGIIIEGSSKPKIRDIMNTVFGDNFGISCSDISSDSPMSFSPCDIIQCTSYILSNIFHAPCGILRLFNAVCSVAYQAVDCLAQIYIERSIKALLSQHTLAHLITLLQDVIFGQKTHQPTKEELEERKQMAFKNITKVHKSIFAIMGLEVSKGLTTVLNILQNPQLNKQLAYSLLDIVVLELYPDCNLNDASRHN